MYSDSPLMTGLNHPATQLDGGNKLDIFPAFMKVSGRPVVVVGGQGEAAAKVRLLSETSADITVIAEDISQPMHEALKLSGAEWMPRPFSFEDIAGAVLVFTAQETEELDRQVVEAAHLAGVPVNAVDRPHLCDFITPSIVNRAPVVVAVSTNGTAPVLARRIKASIERLLPARTGALARFADAFRASASKHLNDGRMRRLFWEEFFDGKPAQAVYNNDLAQAGTSARDLLNDTAENAGFVSLVGAGPGSEDLLTLRAHRVLQNADVVLFDALVAPEILRLARRDATLIPVGKRKGCHSKKQHEINTLMVDHARRGLKVVRLKSGDPMMFGRAGEEIAALRSHDVAYEIVPGITAALAGAAEAEIPLTLRGTASSAVFTTGHDLNGNLLPDWAGLALSGSTVSVYMGRSVAKRMARVLHEQGLSVETPVAILENIGRHDARRFVGTLGGLEQLALDPANQSAALIVIGEAVASVNLNKVSPIKTSALLPEPEGASS